MTAMTETAHPKDVLQPRSPMGKFVHTPSPYAALQFSVGDLSLKDKEKSPQIYRNPSISTSHHSKASRLPERNNGSYRPEPPSRNRPAKCTDYRSDQQTENRSKRSQVSRYRPCQSKFNDRNPTLVDHNSGAWRPAADRSVRSPVEDRRHDVIRSRSKLRHSTYRRLSDHIRVRNNSDGRRIQPGDIISAHFLAPHFQSQHEPPVQELEDPLESTTIAQNAWGVFTTKIRPYIVVSASDFMLTCAPCFTYGGCGVDKKPFGDHEIMYLVDAGREKEASRDLGVSAERILYAEDDFRPAKGNVVRLTQATAVGRDWYVRYLGRVSKDSYARLVAAWKGEMNKGLGFLVAEE